MSLLDDVARQLKIRAATDRDQDWLIPLINSAFAIETFLEGDRTNPERMAEAMGKGTFLVAEDGDERMAACVYIEVRGERGYVGLLAIDPARQGQGIGKLMMQAAQDRLRSQGCVAADIIVLSLRTDLPPFYERLGYTETSREAFTPQRKVREGFACHAIMMSKRL